MADLGHPLLEVQGLAKWFPLSRGLFFRRDKRIVRAVDGISFGIRPGETFALVGESGCGKTTTANLILRLDRATSGQILFDGADIFALEGTALRSFRRSVQAVFQDPYSSLSPRMRVGDIISEPMVVQRTKTRAERQRRIRELLEVVRLPEWMARSYPHELSGGQRQRVAVARAVANEPKLILLDEPVSAVDVSIRAQLINLLLDLQEAFNLAYLLISHDLAMVQHISSRVGVMYLGKLVEIGSGEEFYAHPLHPYTQALLVAALPVDPGEPPKDVPMTGEVSSPINPPTGCRFHPRCPLRQSICETMEPPLREIRPGYWVACHMV